MAVTRGLLVGIREFDQRRFRKGPSKKCHARRQDRARVTHWHLDRWKASHGREKLAVVAMRRVEIADQSRWIAPRRIHERIELLAVHQLQDGGADLLPI